MANKLFIYNMNPENKSIGDCVLRAITNFTISNDLGLVEGSDLAQEKAWYNKHKNAILFRNIRYNTPAAFGPYLNEQGFVRIRVDENVQIKTFNQLASFCKNFGVGALGVANNHMIFTDKTGTMIDSWNSTLKRLKYFYIKQTEADRLGLKYGIDESPYYLFEKKVNTISKECKISPNKIG